MAYLEIMDIQGREILDSRGTPTVEVELVVRNRETGKETSGIAAVPTGASTGEHEALELRECIRERYNGKGTRGVLQNSIELIKKDFIGKNCTMQEYLDKCLIALDDTERKRHLGANVMLGCSMALAVTAAKAQQIPLYRYLGGIFGQKLPIPMMNIINGGRHAKNNLDFQEFMIMPISGGCFQDALRMGAEVYHKLRELLMERGLSVGIGDEGGFAPELSSSREAFLLIQEAVERAGYTPGKDIVYAMDAAASELYNPDGDFYCFQGETKAQCERLGSCGTNQEHLQQTIQPDTICTRITRTRAEMIGLYEALVEEFPLVSIEDGLDQNDWEGWKELTARLGHKTMLVGDDLFVTNSGRLMTGVKCDCGNAILIKPNQIGTVTETLEAIRIAKEHGYKTIISHRSGETEDTFIADLAVAVNAGHIKTGAPCRSERVAKYNRLLRIEEEIKG